MYPLTAINNLYMEYHYTKSVSHITEWIYTEDTSNPPPTPIDNRSMEYCYTK